jgi:dCTP diphosphatase
VTDSLEALTGQVRQFADDRDWGEFHTPKNLAMALAGEVGELVAELQWLSDAQISAELAPDDALNLRLANEMADVLLYLVRLADVAGIDLLGAAARKLAINTKNYPVNLARGTATKYDRLEGRTS